MDFAFLHILRPWALLLLIPTLLFLWWMSKNQDERKKWAKLIAPSFLPHLLVKENANASKLAPFWFVGVVMVLMVLVLAGISWEMKPSPFKDDSAEVAFVLKVTPSMQAEDLKPTRLRRGVFKIDDLLKLRPKLRSALVAYSGSAHLVLPLTRDGAIIQSFAGALDPDVMPVLGDVPAKAVSLAARELKDGGTIVVLCDTLTKAQIDKMADDPAIKDSRLLFFVTMPKAMADSKQYGYAARRIKCDIVYFSNDDSDVRSISSAISHNFKQTGAKNADYKDDGYYLLFPIALVMLFWFRRGFLAEAWRVS